MKEQAIKVFYSGESGRSVGKIFGMSKANVYSEFTGNVIISERDMRDYIGRYQDMQDILKRQCATKKI